MIPASIAPAVKHVGCSVMVWGCFSSSDLTKICCILKKEGYRDILKNIANPSGLSLIWKGFVLQQDNDPKHITIVCKEYIEKQEGMLQIIIGPPQSLDLNPNNLLWKELGHYIRNDCQISKNNLWDPLQNAWKNLTMTVLEKLSL